MPRFARITAVLIEDREPTDDRMVILVPIDDSLTQVDGQYFGYSVDDGVRYPFVGELHGDRLRLDASGLDIDDEAYLNIAKKALAIGELFTRTEKFHDDPETYEDVYRIESVIL